MKIITDLKLGKVNVELIYETNDQSLWVATDRGLFQLADGKWQQSIADQAINYIQQTDQGQLWVATSNGLYHFDHGEWIPELKVAVNGFIELANGALLAGGSDGLRVKPPADETVVMQTELAGELVAGLFLASDGKLWGRSTADFISYDELKWTNHGDPDIDMRKWLYNGATVHSHIYEDSKGVIWFNCGGSPLYAPTWSFSDGQLKPHHIGAVWTHVFVETEQGHILATGSSGGPYVYDGNAEDEWTTISGYGADPATYAVFGDNDGSNLVQRPRRYLAISQRAMV